MRIDESRDPQSAAARDEIDRSDRSAGRPGGDPGGWPAPGRRAGVLALVALVLATIPCLVTSRALETGAGSITAERPPRDRTPESETPPSQDAATGKSPQEPNEAERDYLRFVPGEPGEGELQTSIVTMTGEGGVRVDLIAVVHVADGSYYRQLQKRFRKYDSLLYEMVKDEDVRPVPSEGGGGLLTLFQRTLKNLLDLEFQLDAIDYTRKNFIHADLDPDTFFRLQKERGENLLSLMFKLFKSDLLERQKGGNTPQLGLVQLALALSSDDSARSLKYLLAQQMEHMEELIAGIEDGPSGEGSVIVAARNKKALAVLRERLKAGDKRLGIFYGGAHMPDMEKRLVEEFGLRRVRETWLTAWSIRARKSAEQAGSER